MEVGQNQNTNSRVQYNSCYNCGNNAAPVTSPVPATQTVPAQAQNSYQTPPIQVPAQPSYQIPATTSGVNIQIFNPSVGVPGAAAPTYNVNSPCYPSNYYTQQWGGQPAGQQTGQQEISTVEKTETEEKPKKTTEKKRIVQLTDQYIMNLENYLNSQDKNLRVHAAREVYDRLEEDPSRKNDAALTALVNKMLQDPCEEIRVIALSALEGRIVSGDDFTVNLLQKMQTTDGGYGQDAPDASNILLDMSAKTIDKEVPIDPFRKTKTKNPVKTEKKKETKTTKS